MTDDASLPDDELASAYLDDAVDSDERARVENSPDLLARADALARARRAVASAVPMPDATQRDQHIAKALPALDAAAPISLADRRARRSSRRLAVLSAAAAIVVVAGVLAVMAGRRDHSSLSTASRSSATTAAGGKGTEAFAGGTQNDASASATTAAAGATTTVAAAGYASTVPRAPAVGPTDSSNLGAIDAGNAAAVLRGASDLRLQGPPACSTPVGTHYVGNATYEGTPVFAFVTEPDALAARGVLLDMATCTVVADLPLT